MGYTDSIINKAGAIQTSSLSTGGLLNPEQARKFIQQTFESNELGKHIRHVIRTAKTGEIDKIGIAARLLRKKTENTDDGYRADVITNKLEYATTAVRLPWEITEETLRENIERASFEKIVTDLMTTQIGLDSMDLYLNGDTEVSADNADHDFLYINDGWIKQLKNGHVIDKSSAGTMDIGMFYEAVKAVPNKYNNGKLRWLMSPHRAQEWQKYLLEKCINNGSTAPDSLYTMPVSIPTIQVPALSDDTIILTDPQNLIVVNTYDVKVRKTIEGKEAIMQDKRFYVCHFDFDPIIEELDATAIITGLTA
ncbi:MAG: P2 family phage major capsid protein [Clostridia bacterium]|nr:P2 family phage major capsid protein [Clostridia bacterium]